MYIWSMVTSFRWTIKMYLLEEFVLASHTQNHVGNYIMHGKILLTHCMALIPMQLQPRNISLTRSRVVTLLLRLFGFSGYLPIRGFPPCPHSLNVATVWVIGRLLTMMSFKNTPNILRLIAIFVRQYLRQHTILLHAVSTLHRPADLFTKPHPTPCFRQLLTELSILLATHYEFEGGCEDT